MDIGLVWSTEAFSGDWAVAANGGDLATDPGGLRSAVLMSLFTDAAAPPGYLPPAGSTADRRGYWGDTFEAFPIGSLLWTLDRAKKDGNLTLLIEVQDICSDALQWLITTNVVAAVAVSATWLQANVIGLQVTLSPPQSPPAVFEFAWAWLGA